MKKSFCKAIALSAALFFGSVNIGLAAGGSIGFGDFSVYKNGALVATLSGQNPIEDGALLMCNSKCMIKSEGISLIGEDNAQVAVISEEDTFKIYMKEGKVNFVINSNVRKISFHTPDGTYTVADVIFNADSQAVVKGSVVVDGDGNTEISVTEGRMVFATAEGMKTVDANSKIVLAVIPPGSQQAGGLATATKVVAAAFDAAVIGVGVFSNGNGSTSASPFQ